MNKKIFFDRRSGRMNKQELIEKVKELTIFSKQILNVKLVDKYDVIKLIERLDEPQKPVVPEFVHKYIREARECSWDFQDLFKYIDDEDSEDLQKWFYHECNQETLAVAWINGYEIEEEKRYRIKLKSNSEEVDYLVDTKTNGFRFYSNVYTQKREHTRKEIENAGFGWVFDCPGIEIEEVE